MAAEIFLRSTLIDLLSARAASDPDRVALTFLSDGEERERITYGQLHKRACALAGHLQSAAVAGERALLLLPSGLDFVVSFFGALYAGMIAVPAYPPSAARQDGRTRRLQSIVKDARPSRVLTTGALMARLQPHAQQLLGDAALVDVGAVGDARADRWRRPAVGAESIAFLQYTSGSTALPKGVMVSHGNILWNEHMIQEQFSRSQESTVVSWLPQYHDMGLIGGLLQPLYAGSPGVLMSPTAFLRQPISWLKAVSRYRAHSSGGPSFAYDLVVARTTEQQRRDLDLSNWRVAFNGAEPVRLATIDRFSQAFAPYGFRREAFFPCYGLAEATLIVTGRQGLNVLAAPNAAAGDGDAARQLVSCGAPVPETQVVIVDRVSLEPCSSGEVGEIWVQSPSVAAGYWNQREASDETFGATLPGRPGRFLRTGDLGFLVAGELVVTGRLKDLVIIRGENHHPEDLEATASESHPALRVQPGAAFTAEIGGEDELVVLHGVDRSSRENLGEVASAVRDAISQAHGVRAHTVVLVDAGAIPRTSSGKVQRHLCRAQFQAGALPTLLADVIPAAPVGPAAPPSPDGEEAARLESALRLEIAASLRLDPAQLTPERPFTAWGLDSVGAVELQQRLLQRFGVDVPATGLLAGTTLSELLGLVGGGRARHTEERSDGGAARVENAPRVSVEQQRLWLLSQIAPDKAAYNVCAARPIEGALQPDRLRRAVDEVVGRHAILRARFESTPAGPALHVAEASGAAWDQRYVWGESREQRDDITRRAGLRLAEAPFDLEQGPLVRFLLLTLGPSDSALLVCAHHTVMDAESFRVLFDDVARAYGALGAGRPARDALSEPRRAEPAACQPRDSAAADSERQLEYWRRELAELPEPLCLARPDPPGVARPGVVVGSVRFSVDARTTSELRALGRTNGSTLFMLLLSAWNAAFHRWTGRSEWLAATPVTGRRQIELRDVIGCLAYPLLLRARVSRDTRLRDLMEATRTSLLEAYAHQDVPFTRVVESLRGRGRSSRTPLVQVLFSLIKLPDGPSTEGGVVFGAPQLVRATTDVELFATLAERAECLDGTLFYRSDVGSEAELRALVEGFVAMLLALVRHPEWTVSQVPWPSPPKEPAAGAPAALRVCLAASFAADALEEVLEFWSRTLGTPWAIEIAPPGQVMPALLDPDSAFSGNAHGINVLLVQPSARGLDAAQALAAVEQFQRRAASPLIVAVCPETAPVEDLVALWSRRLEEIPGVHALGPAELLGRYPVDKVHDEFGERVASLPFTDAFYAAAGTLLSRTIHALTARPYKVIVLDCDHTLWDGVCAEDGPEQVRVDGAHAFLQRFMLEQRAAGMLLCLCSKNSEADVAATFAAHPAMPLRLDDFVATRINWLPKSENVRSLAAELDLALDSFVYVDDNPLECAEIESQCPGVLTLCLQRADEIPALLEHLWALDHRGVTGEDRRKTELYRQAAERRAAERRTLTMAEFIAGLALEIDVARARGDELRRVAQLSRRVNQFNVSLRKYTEAELAQRASASGTECLVAHVRDRFGDYGLVGAAVCREVGPALRIEAFFLSCRALGRGVEWRLLNEVATSALERGLARVELDFQRAFRNTPAQDFAARAAGVAAAALGEQATLVLDARAASRVSYGERPLERASPAAEEPPDTPAVTSGVDGAALVRIATRFRNVGAISAELRSARAAQALARRAATEPAAVAAATEVERALAAIWEEVIGVRVTDVSQDLFALGGDSLLAVRMLARVRETFHVELSLDDLFLGPLTVRGVAAAVEEARLSHANPSVS